MTSIGSPRIDPLAGLERRAAELEHFSRALAHDLQGGLRKITSYAELLREDQPGGLSPAAEEDLQVIAGAAARMGVLVRELVDYARLASASLELSPTRLEDCADAAILRLDALVTGTGARIARGPLAEVRGDHRMLTELYVRLLDNAIRYSGESAPGIELTREEGGAGLVFGVRDRGPGIPREYLEDVFLPLRRLHVPGAQASPGAGFGLAVARRVVERHGGRIWVESEPGEGAHVRFLLGGLSG